MLYTVTFGFLVLILCDPSWASKTLTNVNLERSPYSVNTETFIGKAVSLFHCYLMCTRFIKDGCEAAIFDKQKDCFVSTKTKGSSNWLLTTYGYSLQNGRRVFNRKAELMQVNLANADNYCHLGDYPDQRTNQPVAGFVDGQFIVCTGSEKKVEITNHPLCYALGYSRVMASTEKPRGMAASLVISGGLWITGGWNSLLNNKGIEKTTEFVYLGEAKPKPGPNLPLALAGHCLFWVNSTVALLAGGSSSNKAWRGTRFYDFTSVKGGVAKEGPDLDAPSRYGHSCGLVKLGQEEGQKAAVVTGGCLLSTHTWKQLATIQKTELLLLGKENLQWSRGPDFPHTASFQSSAVSAPDGTLNVIGGRDNDASTKFIFQLDCRQGPDVRHCAWHKLQSELMTSLAGHVAALVPEDFAVCGDPSWQVAVDSGKGKGDASESNGIMLIVTGGWIEPNIHANRLKMWRGRAFDTEIIYISPNGKTRNCKAPDHYLLKLRDNAVGGLVYGHPIVCGGSSTTHTKNCERLGSPKKAEYIEMLDLRYNAASILISRKNGAEQKLWVTGGRNGKASWLSSTEYVSTNKMFSGPGVYLPFGLKYHCMARFNRSTVVLLGGLSHRSNLRPSLFMDTDKETLTEAPTLTEKRYLHQCGQISLGTGGENVVVMTGGTVERRKAEMTEVLMPDQDGFHVWVKGPDLPPRLQLGDGVSTPDGSFLMVAGQDSFSASILRLTCSTTSIQSCQWKKLEGELFVRRRQHVTIVVPSSYITCTP